MSSKDLSLKPAFLKPNAYKTIVLYSSRYANQSIHQTDWKEVYGVLSGYSDGDVVWIYNAYPLTEGTDDEIILRPEHYEYIAEIQDKLDEQGNDHFIVGWFHSHPNSLSFTQTDIINHISFQSQFPDAVAIVYDFTVLGQEYEKEISDEGKVKVQHTGMEAYRVKDVEMEKNNPQFPSNYQRMDIYVDGLSKSFFAQLMIELSGSATNGQPLQESYGESRNEISPFREMEHSISETMKEGNYDRSKKLILKLYDVAMDKEDDFYLATALYWKAVWLETNKLNSNADMETIKQVLLILQKASALFEKEKDFAGAGLCLDRISGIYQRFLQEPRKTLTFIKEAVTLYEKAISRPHPLRDQSWSDPSAIQRRVDDIERSLIE